MFTQTTRHCQCLPRCSRHVLQSTSACPSTPRERPPPQRAFRQCSIRTHGYHASSTAEALKPDPTARQAYEKKDIYRHRDGATKHLKSRAKRELHLQDEVRSRRAPAQRNQRMPSRRTDLQSLISREMRRSPAPSFRGLRDKYGLFEALQLGTPKQFAHVLAKASRDLPYMRGLPRTLWTEILRYMAPKRWLPKASSYHQLFYRPGNEPQQENGSMATPVDDLMGAITEIVRILRQVGIPMGFVDYKILVSHARDLENPRMAQSLIEDMRHDGFEPDIDCLNYYTLSMLHHEQQRFGLLRWSNGSGSKRIMHEPGPLRLYRDGALTKIRSIYDGIRYRPDITLDTTAFCTYMTALAREGELDAVSEVLKEAWGLDSNDPDADIPESKLRPEGDPLYPNRRLLTTIAEAFGSHDRIGTALKLIDKASLQYDVSVDIAMWRALLLWTWVHARRRQQALREKNRVATEKIAKETQSRFFDSASATQAPTELPGNQLQIFETLFDAMSNDNPAFARNMNIMNMRFLNNLGRGITGSKDSMSPIRAGHEAHSKLLQEQASASRIAGDILNQRRRDSDSNSGEIPGLKGGGTAAALLAQQQLDVKISRRYLRQWSRRVIETGVPNSYVDNASEQEQAQIHQWRLCGIPDLVAQSLSLLPHSVRYQVPGGVVDLGLGPVKERGLNQATGGRTHRYDDTSRQEELDEGIGSAALA